MPTTHVVVVGKPNIDPKKKSESSTDEHDVEFERAVQLTGKGFFHVTIALACGFSFLAAGFQNSLNAYILPSVGCDLHITSSDMGLLNAVFLAGGISSNFMWGILADMMGRKTVLVSGMLIDAVLTLMSSFSQHFYVLLIFRYLNGFIVGGPSSIVFAYMSEFFPEKLRAKVICYVGTFWTVSWLILPAVAWFVIPIKWSYNSHGIEYNSWRILVALVSVPSLLSAFILMLYPESPRFVLAKGRNQEARDILAKVYSWNTRKSPDKYPVKSLRYEEKVVYKSGGSNNETKSVWTPLTTMVQQAQGLFAAHTLKITLMWCTLFFSNMFGYYGLGLWLPELFNRFEKHYQYYPDTTVTLCEVRTTFRLENNSTAPQCDSTAVDPTVFMKAVVIGFVGLFGNVISGVLAGRLHRRTMPVVLMTLSGVCVIVIYFLSSPTYNLIVTAGFQLFIGTANLVYNSLVVDVFPPSVSGMGVCLGILTGRLGAMVSNLVFGHLIDVSCSIPIFLVAGVCIGGGLLSMFISKYPYSEPGEQEEKIRPEKITIIPM